MKARRPWSLATRLTIWYAGSTFAILLLATGILYWALVTNLGRQDDQFLVDEVHILQDLLAERPEYVDAIRQEIEWEAAARRYARVYVRLLDDEGRTVAETPEMSDKLPAELSALAETFNEMLDRLRESFDRLSRFSADIAHELRTPVNNLRGEAEVTLGKTRSLDEYREAIGSCLEEAVRLSQIIDGLLLLARADAPEVELQREPLDLATELDSLRDFYEAAAAEADVRLEVNAKPGLQVHASRPLVQRAIGNLVENAIAHTPIGGEVSITATEDDGLIYIAVSDTGHGIPENDVEHVFDRFYRVERDRSSTSGGSGLGLAIVRSISEMHGGHVDLQSEPGAGTTVTLSLPRKPQ